MKRIFDYTEALVRQPGASAVRGLRAAGGPDPVLGDLLTEHAAYVAALAAAGLDVTQLGSLEQFPDALFVEDPALVFPGLAVLLNPGAQSRAGEVAALRPDLESRFERVEPIAAGHADGGDVLVMPGRAFIGLSARTDPSGAEALARILDSIGLTSTIVTPPAGVLHLKAACSLIDEETVLATGAIARSSLFAGYRVIEVLEGDEAGANVLRLGDRVLIGAAFPRIAEQIEKHGVTPALLSTASIAMIDAGLTCMSLRW